MATVTIFHNPRCSKSRAALELLRRRGVEPEVVEYLKAPLDETAVRELIERLGIEPHVLLRAREEPYARHGLSTASSAAQVARAIAADPVLLERPVVVVGDRAVIGRPPERVLELIE